MSAIPMKFEIKSRLAALGKTQKDLFVELNKRGHKISTVQQLYQYVNESIVGTPRSETIICASKQVINEWERR